MFYDDLCMDAKDVGCMIPREYRYFPREWDLVPVGPGLRTYYPHLKFLVRVAVYFEPKFLLKIKFINYFLFHPQLSFRCVLQ